MRRDNLPHFGNFIAAGNGPTCADRYLKATQRACHSHTATTTPTHTQCTRGRLPAGVTGRGRANTQRGEVQPAIDEQGQEVAMGTRGTHHPARVGGGVGGCLLLLLLGCGQCNYDKKPSRGGVSASRMIRVRHVAARPAPRLPARDNPGRAADTGRAKGMRRCRAVVIPQQKQRRQQHGGGGGRHHAQPSRPVAQPNHNTHLDESNDAACRGGALLGARRRGRGPGVGRRCSSGSSKDTRDGDSCWQGGSHAHEHHHHDARGMHTGG